MATHSSMLLWEIPWREEPGGLQSMELQRAGHGQRLIALSFLRVFRPIVSFGACSSLVFFIEAPKAQRG